MELLCVLENNNTKVIGREGLVKYQNGSFWYSRNFPGTTDLSRLPNASAIALVKNTIMQTPTEWEKKPEVNDAELLFCITTNT